MGNPCSTHGRNEKCVQNFVAKPEWRRTLGRPKRRWEENIRKDLREVEWEGADWLNLAQYRDQWRAVVNMVMKLRVP
jgi:hypothetical protein